MKLPNTFRPYKDLDKKIEELVNLDPSLKNPSVTNVQKLLSCCAKFVKNNGCRHSSKGVYMEASDMVKEAGNYSMEDLKIVTQCFKVKDDSDLDVGFYLSLLTTNKVPEGGSETLVVTEKLNGIGSFLNKNISLTFEADVYCFAGAQMSHGNLIITGDSELYTSHEMEGGKVTIEGDTGYNTAWLMKGGELHVNGNLGNLVNISGGTVYNKGEKVWPK